jgi:hypothetical protein
MLTRGSVMRRPGIYVKVLAAVGFLALLLAVPAKAPADEIRFEGSYTAAANGDVAVAFKFTPPMAVYQQLRNSISNLYLLLRGLAPARAEIEVVDKKADWDDSNRTLTFSYKTLGLARNMGKRWEIDVLPGVDYSNCNEATKTVYFNEDATGPLGRVRGISRLTLPDQARDIRWDEARRVVNYTLPIPAPSRRGSQGLFIMGLILLVVGALLTAMSFLRRWGPPPLEGAGPGPKLIKHED